MHKQVRLIADFKCQQPIAGSAATARASATACINAAAAQVQSPDHRPSCRAEKGRQIAQALLVDHCRLRRGNRRRARREGRIIRSVSANADDPARAKLPHQLNIDMIARAEQPRRGTDDISYPSPIKSAGIGPRRWSRSIVSSMVRDRPRASAQPRTLGGAGTKRGILKKLSAAHAAITHDFGPRTL